jgi:hypothetical protein
MTQRGDKRAHRDVQASVPAEHGRSRRSVSKRPKAEDCHMAETNKCAHPACKCLVSKEGPVWQILQRALRRGGRGH